MSSRVNHISLLSLFRSKFGITRICVHPSRYSEALSSLKIHRALILERMVIASNLCDP